MSRRPAQAAPSTAWKPGTTGNPDGYSKARREADRERKEAEEAWQNSLREMLPEALTALREKANEGDVAAIKLLMDRCIPALKPTDRMITLPALRGVPLDQAGPVILEAIGDGRLSPEQGKTLIEIHTALLRSVEVAAFSEFLRRLREGEAPLSLARELANREAPDGATTKED